MSHLVILAIIRAFSLLYLLWWSVISDFNDTIVTVLGHLKLNQYDGKQSINVECVLTAPPSLSHSWVSLFPETQFWNQAKTDYAAAFGCVDHNKRWKILQEMGIPDHLTCFLRNLCAGQEATVRTGHGKIGLKLGKDSYKVVYCHSFYLTCMQNTYGKCWTG